MNERDTTGSGIVTKDAAGSVDEVLERLESTLASRNMKVFTVIDHSGEAQAVDLELRDTKVVVFGRPASGTLVMQAVPLAALDLPLKVLIWDDGGQTRLSYTSPAALARRHGLDGTLAERISGIDPITDALVENR